MNMANKARLRASALAKREALSAEERAACSARIMAHVLKKAAHFPVGPISVFWPIRSEIDTRPLMVALRAAGQTEVLPRVEGDVLEFRLWHATTKLASGPFGLCEPGLDAPLIRPLTMLIPLAAFDRRGHRIGYGKGFYDRAIAALNPALKIGLAFSCQEIEAVPNEGHDEILDNIITENGVIESGRA